jgi:DNA-binding winged helix-turn-helix (wHTH) protein/TolB-like protein
MAAGAARTFRFGVFLFDAVRFDLRRDGRSVKLQRQPAQVLAVLLERAGQMVGRDELRRAVWGDDTHVDFDRGLNFCIAQIRTALADDAASPRYLRTLPKKGYEFICPVEVVEVVEVVEAVEGGDAVDVTVRPLSRFRGRRRLVLSATALAIVAAAAGFAYLRHARQPTRPIVAIVRFDNETGEPALTRFSDYLTDTLIVQMSETEAGRYDVVGNAAILRVARERRDLRAIASSLGASYVVLGQLQRDTGGMRVLGHLIRLPEQTHVSVARLEDVKMQTLAETSEIASRISETFARRLNADSPSAASR